MVKYLVWGPQSTWVIWMLFCFLLAQEQKRREMILARELKKPVEDMVLKDSKVIEIHDYTGLLELCRRRDLNFLNFSTLSQFFSS